MEKEIMFDDIERTSQEKAPARTVAEIMSAADAYGDQVAGEYDGEDLTQRAKIARDAVQEYLARPSVMAELKAIKDAETLALEEQENQDR